MKVPYRTGDSFALPLGDGSTIPARIVACDHHVVTVVASGVTLRVYDSALVLRRWRAVDGASTTSTRSAGEARVERAQDDNLASNVVFSPAKAERTFAELLGVKTFDTSPVLVLTCEIPGVVRSSAGMRLNRVDAETMAFAAGATALTIAAPVNAWKQPFPNVARLTLDASCSFDDIAQTFPSLRALRIGDGVKRVNFADLAQLHTLDELDISHAIVDGFEALAEMHRLRALRLAHVEGLLTLEPMCKLRLQTLAIEHQPQLQGIEALRACTTLEQLELIGLWQFAIEECGWLYDLERLTRVAVDIGGRRKNLELYARARWAYPWPSFSDARLTSVVPLERTG